MANIPDQLVLAELQAQVKDKVEQAAQTRTLLIRQEEEIRLLRVQLREVEQRVFTEHARSRGIREVLAFLKERSGVKPGLPGAQFHCKVFSIALRPNTNGAAALLQELGSTPAREADMSDRYINIASFEQDEKQALRYRADHGLVSTLKGIYYIKDVYEHTFAELGGYMATEQLFAENGFFMCIVDQYSTGRLLRQDK